MLNKQSAFTLYRDANAAAHGLTGILHTLALALKQFPMGILSADREWAALITCSALALADHALPSGNLPSSHGSDADK